MRRLGQLLRVLGGVFLIGVLWGASCSRIPLPPVSGRGGGPAPTASLAGAASIGVTLSARSPSADDPMLFDRFVARVESRLRGRGVVVRSSVGDEAIQVRVSLVGVRQSPRHCGWDRNVRARERDWDCEQEIVLDFDVEVDAGQDDVALYAWSWEGDLDGSSVRDESVDAFERAADVLSVYLRERGL